MIKIYHPRVEKKCEYCGELYKVLVARANTSRFCSWECKLNGYVKPIVVCKNCGEHFRARATKRAESGRQIFCSRECKSQYAKNNRQKIVCERCGKEFDIYPSRLKFGNPRFCSQSCAGNMKKWQNERFTRIKTNEWKQIRASIIKRDGGKCANCGGSKMLTVHHIVKWSISKDDSPSNLITLCRSCHYSIEWNGVPCPKPPIE